MPAAAPYSAGSAPQPMASAAPAAAAPTSSSSADALAYSGGLPLRRADPTSISGPCREALEAAGALIRQHCTDLDFANGAIHGVRALGRAIDLGGDDSFRVLLERYTRERYTEGRVLLEVPVRQEGHRNAMLKTLIENHCDLDLTFEHEQRTYRFRDYVDSARLLCTGDPTQRIDEHSWTIMALARVTPSDRSSWTNVYGHSVNLGTLIDRTSSVLLQDTQLVRQLDLDLAEVPRNCPAFGRVCGALHMLYALAVALSCGHTNERRRSEFARHMQTLVRRFRYDLKVIDQVEQLNRERVGADRASSTAFDARCKFLGHAFEIVGLVQQFDLYAFSSAERERVDSGREALCRLLVRSGSLDWSGIREDRELYESVVYGICHAYNGLLLSA